MTSTLHDIFEEAARENADRIAVVGPQGGLTYRDLAVRSNRVAHALQRIGAGPESRVGLCIDRSLDLIVGMLGILKAGAAYVPIDPEYPADRIALLLQDSAPQAVVSVSRVAATLAHCPAPVLCIDSTDPAMQGLPEVPVASGCGAGNLAYVIYTSGSTGRPKGVQVEHRSAVRLFTATQPWFAFGAQDVWTLAHSYAFDFSVWEIFGALLHGGCLVVVPADVTRSPQRYCDLLREHAVTVLSVTPSAFRGIAAEDARLARDLKLRLVVFGGEKLDVRMLAGWFTRHAETHPRLVNMYGITETTVHATYRPLTARDVDLAPASPIGIPLPDLRVELLDESGRPVPDGAAGEIYLSGAGVARDYLHAPQLSAQRFVTREGTRYYRSGDRALRAPDGDLHYVGRVDEQVKVRGFRIEPREIETVLAQDHRVASAIVVARDYGEGDVRLVAHVVPEAAFDMEGEGPRTLAFDLAQLAALQLPEHLRPSHFHVVANLPITPHGKVDRDALARLAPERDDDARAQSAAATTTVARIAAIWQDVLELAEIGLRDDFFDLGGTSLAVVRMLGRVNEICGVALDPSALLEEASIEHLARVVDTTLHARTLVETKPC